MTTEEEIRQLAIVLHDGNYLKKWNRIVELFQLLPSDRGRNLYYEVFPFGEGR